MDEQLEAQVIRQLAQWVTGRTLVLVTHRPTLLRMVDRIIVLLVDFHLVTMFAQKRSLRLDDGILAAAVLVGIVCDQDLHDALSRFSLRFCVRV